MQPPIPDLNTQSLRRPRLTRKRVLARGEQFGRYCLKRPYLVLLAGLALGFLLIHLSPRQRATSANIWYFYVGHHVHDLRRSIALRYLVK
jgi:hypothetical protein